MIAQSDAMFAVAEYPGISPADVHAAMACRFGGWLGHSAAVPQQSALRSATLCPSHPKQSRAGGTVAPSLLVDVNPVPRNGIQRYRVGGWGIAQRYPSRVPCAPLRPSHPKQSRARGAVAPSLLVDSPHEWIAAVTRESQLVRIARIIIGVLTVTICRPCHVPSLTAPNAPIK